MQNTIGSTWLSSERQIRWLTYPVKISIVSQLLGEFPSHTSYAVIVCQNSRQAERVCFIDSFMSVRFNEHSFGNQLKEKPCHVMQKSTTNKQFHLAM